MESRVTHDSDQSTSKFNWRALGVLVGLIAVGNVALIPYSLGLGADTLKSAVTPIPLLLLIAVQALEGTVLYSILAGIGLFVAGRIGLGDPITEAWTEGRSAKGRLDRIFRPALVVGIAGGAILIALEAGVFGPLLSRDLSRLGISMPSTLRPPAWPGLLAGLYGAFDVEILLRLFVMAVLAWLGSRVWRSGSQRPRDGVLWTANILAALLFGLGHLPATAAAGLPIDSLVITRAVVMNGLLGVAFGWLYFTAGLESAMLAHFTGDIMLHVVGALLMIV